MINSFLSELKRRGVIQTLTAYVVSSWVIIEVCDIAVPLFALPSWVTTLVGVMLLTGFPIAAYLSWFFNYSDGVISRATDAAGGPPQPLRIWHWLGLGTIAFAAASAGFYLYEDISDKIRKDEEGILIADVEETIAIVPFDDLSPDRDQAFLAQGIAGEIASLLGRLDGVRTAATSASFRLSDQGVTPLDIGRQLSTATVLTGSVHASGSRLRLRAELLRTDDGSVLWSSTFTRTLNDVFVLQEEVARSLANLLADQYVEANEMTSLPKTASSDAYVFYLKGRAELRNKTTESVKAARKLFEQSVALDPEYAPAHVGVADTMWQLADGVENLGNLDVDVAASVARRSVERALLIDDTLPSAYATLGRVEALLKRFEDSITHYDKAISLNESLFDAHVWRFLSLNNLNRFSEAMQALEQAAELDPTAPTILYNLGYERSKRGDFAVARQYFEKLIQLEPDNPVGYRGLAAAAFREGQLALSLDFWFKARELDPDSPHYQSSYKNVLLSLGMVDNFRELAADTGDEVNALLIEGDFEAVDEKMRFLMAANPEDPWLVFEAGWYRHLAGDTTGGDALFERADESFSDADRFVMPMCSPAIELVSTYRNRGDEGKANTYLSRCETLLKTAQRSVLEDNFLDHLAARVAALRNRPVDAVAHMQTAFDHGWREWWTELDPLFTSLSDDPEFQRLLVEIRNDLDRQRAIANVSLQN